MINSKVKFLTLGIVASLLISSTPALAATKSDNDIKTTSDSQVLQKSNFQMKKSKVVYTQYTYETAPEEVKAQYESDCKSVDKTPNSSDIISVPQNLDSSGEINRAASYAGNNYYVGYDNNSSIRVIDDYGNVYYANIYNDYVGYNNQTSGSAVRCLQALLNEVGYNVNVDGIFGPNTHSAIISFQRNHDMSVDATVGPNTWKALLRADGF